MPKRRGNKMVQSKNTAIVCGRQRDIPIINFEEKSVLHRFTQRTEAKWLP